MKLLNNWYLLSFSFISFSVFITVSNI
jgi:hypothetical protein